MLLALPCRSILVFIPVQYSSESKWASPPMSDAGKKAWARTPPGPSKFRLSPWFFFSKEMRMSAFLLLTSLNVSFECWLHKSSALVISCFSKWLSMYRGLEITLQDEKLQFLLINQPSMYGALLSDRLFVCLFYSYERATGTSGSEWSWGLRV